MDRSTHVSPLGAVRNKTSNASVDAHALSQRSYSNRWQRQRVNRRLPAATGQKLRDEDAPWGVLRWVVMGARLPEMVLRGEVMLAVRHGVDRPGGGWPQDFEKMAALNAYLSAPEVVRARERRQVVPAPDEIDPRIYARAMEDARRARSQSRRRAAPPSPDRAAVVLTKKQAQALAILRPVLDQLAR
jgi:hypothetical protein